MGLCDSLFSGTQLSSLFPYPWDTKASPPNATQLYMVWITKVPAWVVPLLTEYVIPENATVLTGVEFGKLGNPDGITTLSGNSRTAVYPGIIPNYSLVPEIQTQTSGVQYNLKARKAVGFYGVITDVLSFDNTKLNRWEYPLVRRNFGFCSLSKGVFVAHDEPLHYQEQIIISPGTTQVAINYDDDFSLENIFNDADSFALDRFDCFLYPSVLLQVGFLPIWEVWAVRFFQA